MIEFDAGSFKDPDGRVFYADGSVFRTLSPSASNSLKTLADGDFFKTLIRDGAVVESAVVPADTFGFGGADVGKWVVQQTKVPFVTYPFEWSFDMLRDAALLTLTILERSLLQGYVLKDATPFNILFFRNQPVLIDVLSFEKRNDGEPWAGYAQFCRGFLFPLLINAYRKIDFQPLMRGHLGEIPLATTRNIFNGWDSFRPGILKDVLLQSKLDRGFATSPQAVRKGTASFLFSTEMILANVRRLQKIISGLPYSRGLTTWGGYTDFHNYTDQDEATKRAFVEETVARRKPRVCLDLGCNTGDYSELALRGAESVVSVDIDTEAINSLYLKVKSLRQNQSLLVADLSNPTPGLGWRLAERKPFFERVRADFFLGLALIHHLRITAGIPLEKIVDQFADLAPEGIVEWVDKRDGMVGRMLTLRKDVYADYTWENFQALLQKRFTLTRVVETHGGNRKLCHVSAK